MRLAPPVSLLTCCHVLPDLEWKITYVGSAESSEYDQVLDSVLVGPVAVGSYRFVFQACGTRSCVERERRGEREAGVSA